jgi:hypothetical protein
MQYQRNQRHYEQNVNQRPGHMENAETQDPADQENDEQNGENTHRLTSVSQAVGPNTAFDEHREISGCPA